MAMDWQGAPASPSSYTVKRILRLDIPVDPFSNEDRRRGRSGLVSTEMSNFTS
ncbi:hypothetical protein CTI12_AA292930 [Artemisia annua]|uniref:Uncharacterized protein n=1 Tax=Artemisia annua TaxID=35608 RepID=A0A2U1N9B0_ARTAN|nr:hypothetical protein CTI12_AA292930 [Artemisia annua]